GEQSTTHYKQAGYRAAVECHAQCVDPRDAGGLRGANVCKHGHTHSDETSSKRTERANYKSNCGRRATLLNGAPRMIFENEYQYENDHRDNYDRLYLP